MENDDLNGVQFMVRNFIIVIIAITLVIVVGCNLDYFKQAGKIQDEEEMEYNIETDEDLDLSPDIHQKQKV